MSSTSWTWDFFIAHADPDKQSAEKLYAYLKEYNVFLDTRTLQLGDDWDIELPKAQRNSFITIVLISSKSEAAYYQREEIATAIYLARKNPDNHRVVPIYLDNDGIETYVPYGLGLKQGITITADLTLKDVAIKLIDLYDSLLEKLAIPAFSQSLTKKKLNDIKEDESIIFHVSALNNEFTDYPKLPEFKYSAQNLDDLIEIVATSDYLSNYNNGGPIEPLSFTYSPFKWDFPNIDLKIVNNSDKTIFLTEIIFDITESCLDPSPILVVKSDSARFNALNYTIVNEGWGDVLNFKARFNLNPLCKDHSAPDFSEPYKFEKFIERFSDRIDICISDSLETEGVDINSLISSDYDSIKPEYLGKFIEGGATVSGELQYDFITLDGQLNTHKIKFYTIVWLYNRIRYGIPAPPTYQYDTKFQVEGKNYQQRVPISHVLKPQEADRFSVKVKVDKSSIHKFRLDLLYNNNQRVESSKIQLKALIPRSGMNFVR